MQIINFLETDFLLIRYQNYFNIDVADFKIDNNKECDNLLQLKYIAYYMKIALIILPTWSIKTPPLGISYASSSLRKADHDVYDMNIKFFHKFINQLKKYLQDKRIQIQKAKTILSENKF